MKEETYKIITAINKEISNVPADENGYYSPGSVMFIAGLNRAKDIIQKLEEEKE